MVQRIWLVASAALCCLLASTLSAQNEATETPEPQTELDRVKVISAMTGRPIFAVAGQST